MEVVALKWGTISSQVGKGLDVLDKNLKSSVQVCVKKVC